MKTLRAKIKRTSSYYSKGLNNKAKPIWLSVTGFSAYGEKNFRIKAIKTFSGGYAEYEDIWLSPQELTFKHFEDGQLSLELYSEKEWEEIKQHPRYLNKYRYEINTPNQRQYIYAPNIEMAKTLASEMGLSNFTIKPVTKVVKKE